MSLVILCMFNIDDARACDFGFLTISVLLLKIHLCCPPGARVIVSLIMSFAF